MKYIRYNKQIQIVLAYLAFYLVIFSLLEKRVNVSFCVLDTPFDKKIPFCELFIIPYYLWFVYIAVAVVYFAISNNSKVDFQQLSKTLCIGMTLFLLISYIYPNSQSLRPVTFGRDNIFIDMVKFLYDTDTSTNVFPSIHVFNSVAVHLAIAKCDSLKKHSWIVKGSLILTILIVFSTIFLKQHAIIDVYGALVLNLICYIKIYKPYANIKAIMD